MKPAIDGKRQKIQAAHEEFELVRQAMFALEKMFVDGSPIRRTLYGLRIKLVDTHGIFAAENSSEQLQ